MFKYRGKHGDDEGETKEGKQNPKETFIKLPGIVVEKNITMRETVNALHRQISKKMQKHSENLSK